MKYTGRITGTVLLMFIMLFTFIEDVYSAHGYSNSTLFVALLFPLLWILGEKYDRAQFLSEKDTLTDIYNRRFVKDIFPKLTALSERKHEKVSISVIDVDNFKEINDKYGHKQGDQVLQMISQSLLYSARKSDVVVRWGGDEFIVIAPGTDQTGSEIMVKRFEASIQEKSKELHIEISVSIGTSIYPDDSLHLEQLIETADKNMYKVKSGKKRDGVFKDTIKAFH